MKKEKKKNLDEQTAWCMYAAPYIMKVIRRKFGIKRNQLLVMKTWTRVVCLDLMEYLENIFLLEHYVKQKKASLLLRNCTKSSKQRITFWWISHKYFQGVTYRFLINRQIFITFEQLSGCLLAICPEWVCLRLLKKSAAWKRVKGECTTYVL